MAGSASHRGGAGEPIVLIHGLGGTWHSFAPIIAALESEHEVLAVGLRGHWGSTPLERGVRVSVAALVDGVERDLDAAGIRTAHLVGNSLGGWIALELAKRGRARSVVAIAPAGGFTLGTRVAELTAIRILLEHLFTKRWLAPHARALTARPRMRRALFAGIFERPELLSARHAAEMLLAFGETPIFRAVLAGMRRDGPLAGLDGISVPVLVLWGTHDLVLPMRHFMPLIRDGIPGVEVRVLEGLGHVPMLDDPDLIASIILDFVDRDGG